MGTSPANCAKDRCEKQQPGENAQATDISLQEV